MLQPFHLAIPVHSLKASREFYGEFLGFAQGRSNEKWIDWDFFGHQLVTHLKNDGSENKKIINPVDGKKVPVPHFGVVLKWEDWHELAKKVKDAKIEFIIEPYVRFRGKLGEQATMFFFDPSGNALEFKSFKDPSQLFAKDE